MYQNYEKLTHKMKNITLKMKSNKKKVCLSNVKLGYFL